MEISRKRALSEQFRRRRRSRPRRVAIFTGAYNHVVDGIALTLNRLVGHLESEGYEVLVFAPTMGEPALDHKGTLVEVPSFKIPFRKDYLVSTGLFGEAHRRLHEFRPDLIHIATPDFLGLTALLYALRHRVELVASYHTHFSSYLKYYHLQIFEPLLWVYLRWAYGKCRHLYVPTESMARVLRGHGLGHNMRMWPRGIETGRFRPQNRSMAWRRRLGIGDDEVVVLFVSRLVWEKSLDVLAQTLQHLTARGVPHRAVVIGAGPAYAELKRMSPDETIFLGYQGGADLATAYASSDVFLFPSASETFGNVTLEAMASGLPVVCADAPGSASLVIDRSTGYLCPPGDSAAFAMSIEKLVADEGLRSGMGDAARVEARKYDWDVVLATMITYYDEVLVTVAESRARPRSVPRRLAALAD